MTTSQDIEKKIQEEVDTIILMIKIYCKGNHRPDGELCEDCSNLVDYALERVDNCPIRSEKVFCSECTIHCYKPDMRERVKIVMRYSGPRMIWHDPVMAFHHMRARHKMKKEAKQNAS